jgi:hypothetical protein
MGLCYADDREDAIWMKEQGTEIVTELILGHERLGKESNYNYSKLKRKEKEERAIIATL